MLRSGEVEGRGESVHAEVNGINAALVTANPTRLDVRDSEVTELVYTFATTDGVITLGSGAISISVDVVRPEALAACNLASDYYGSGCPSGQTCLMADEGGRTFCATPGPLPVGAACDSQQCVAGAQCLAPEEGLGVHDTELRAKHIDGINAFRGA